MSLSTRAVGAALAAAALTVVVAPAAGAATTDDRQGGRGNLRVCVDQLNGRDAEINVRGPSDESADTDGGCTTFYRLRIGFYRVALDAPRGCDDDSARAFVRRDRTTTVFLDADCHRWRHWDGGGDGDRWNHHDGDRDRGGDPRG